MKKRIWSVFTNMFPKVFRTKTKKCSFWFFFWIQKKVSIRKIWNVVGRWKKKNQNKNFFLIFVNDHFLKICCMRNKFYLDKILNILKDCISEKFSIPKKNYCVYWNTQDEITPKFTRFLNIFSKNEVFSKNPLIR